MLYTLEVRTGGKWRSMGMLNDSGIDYLMPKLVELYGQDNVTYRPSLDGVDYIGVEDE